MYAGSGSGLPASAIGLDQGQGQRRDGSGDRLVEPHQDLGKGLAAAWALRSAARVITGWPASSATSSTGPPIPASRISHRPRTCRAARSRRAGRKARVSGRSGRGSASGRSPVRPRRRRSSPSPRPHARGCRPRQSTRQLPRSAGGSLRPLKNPAMVTVVMTYSPMVLAPSWDRDLRPSLDLATPRNREADSLTLVRRSGPWIAKNKARTVQPTRWNDGAAEPMVCMGRYALPWGVETPR